jgi:hypothetical protein
LLALELSGASGKVVWAIAGMHMQSVAQRKTKTLETPVRRWVGFIYNSPDTYRESIPCGVLEGHGVTMRARIRTKMDAL